MKQYKTTSISARNDDDLASEGEEEETEEIENEAVHLSPAGEDNFQEVVQLWETTFQQRQKLLRELSLVQYVKKYPMLNLSNGYELVCCRFRYHMFVNTKSI